MTTHAQLPPFPTETFDLLGGVEDYALHLERLTNSDRAQVLLNEVITGVHSNPKLPDNALSLTLATTAGLAFLIDSLYRGEVGIDREACIAVAYKCGAAGSALATKLPATLRWIDNPASEFEPLATSHTGSEWEK